MLFVQNLLAKTPKCLWKSCRGVLDLQLCYLSQGALQLKKSEKNSFKVCQSEWFLPLGIPERVTAPASHVTHAVGPSGPGSRGRLPSAGPCAVGPPSRPSPFAPRAPHPQAGRADHAVAPPTVSPSYLAHAHRHVATMPSWLTSKPPLQVAASYER
jgi:hypothetical protein